MSKITLTRYGNALKDYIQEDHPKLFKNLDELDQFCLDRENRAIQQRQQLVNQGLNHSEAEEIVWQELMALDQ